jgi:hypothetical protein
MNFINSAKHGDNSCGVQNARFQQEKIVAGAEGDNRAPGLIAVIATKQIPYKEEILSLYDLDDTLKGLSLE